ncbi:MAG: hypothetical protein ACLTNY_01730 [Blautia massiliensis (ex Durand et al. 2017)]
MEHIRAVEGGQIAVCRVRRPNALRRGAPDFRADSVADSDRPAELERREGWENTLEPAADRSLGLAVSLLVCGSCGGLRVEPPCRGAAAGRAVFPLPGGGLRGLLCDGGVRSAAAPRGIARTGAGPVVSERLRFGR